MQHAFVGGTVRVAHLANERVLHQNVPDILFKKSRSFFVDGNLDLEPVTIGAFQVLEVARYRARIFQMRLPEGRGIFSEKEPAAWLGCRWAALYLVAGSHRPEEAHSSCLRVSKNGLGDLHSGDDACASSKEDNAAMRAQSCQNVKARVRSTQPDGVADRKLAEVAGHFSAFDGAYIETQAAIGRVLALQWGQRGVVPRNLHLRLLELNTP